jgi:TRAP-type mannitol/chloroaromatic compound transport system permease small subunit
LFIELQWYLYSLVFLLSFAHILKHGINVRVDFWYGRQPPRRKMWIDLIGHLVALLPFCLLALAVTTNPVLLSWGRLPGGGWGAWELSPDPNGLPRAPIKSMILLTFLSLLLQAMAETIRLVAMLRGVDLATAAATEYDMPRRIE